MEIVGGEMEPLQQEMVRLKRALQKAESLEFIRVNKITKSSVQLSDGEDLPWMGDVWQFGKWLKDNSDKPWCAWNGLIYQSSEIINGRMSRDAVGRVVDI